MLQIPIGVIKDIEAVAIDNEGTVIIYKDKVYFEQNYRGKTVVTWIKGDGVMEIFAPKSNDWMLTNELNPGTGILYDIHWSTGKDIRDEYREHVKKAL